MVKRNLYRYVALGCLAAALCLADPARAGQEEARSRWNEAYREYFDPDHASEVPSPDPEAAASLDGLLRLAESRNPGLRASFDRWTAALDEGPRNGSLPDPRFSYAYFIEPVETRVGPQRQRFGISQTIPLFGKMGLSQEIGNQGANAAGAEFETIRLDLRFTVTKIWNDFYFLNRAIAITRENLGLLTNFENVALAQYTVGRAPHSAIIRVQVEVGRLEDRLRTLQDQRGPLAASLNAEINRPPDAPVAWPDTISVRPLAASREDLLSALLAGNPQLASLSYLKERDAGAARLAGKSSLPDLTLGIDYIDTDKARYGDFPDSGNDAVMATASINIPLWSGRTGAEKSRAAARLSATENEYLQLKNRLLADFERAHFELRDAERRVELYAYTLLPKARQAMEVTNDAFITGEAGFLDLIDTQRTLLEFELAHERALADLSTRRAKLEQIVGTDLDTIPKAED